MNTINATKKQLTKSADNIMNEEQLSAIFRKTPDRYIRTRPAKGGGVWKYVTGGYMIRTLNTLFGWDWDFEIIDEQILKEEVIVKGKLTCRTGGKQIIKVQFGNKEIVYKKGTQIPLSIGNDLKAAATDALKKCASEIGIASDIYAQDEFIEIVVNKTTGTIVQEKENARIERLIKEATCEADLAIFDEENLTQEQKDLLIEKLNSFQN